jgi:predicted enzyme related to lactoylglutathione lyase
VGDDSAGGSFEGPILLARDFGATVSFYRTTLGLPVEGAEPYAKCVSGASAFAIAEAKWWAQANGPDNPYQGESSVSTVVLRIEVANVEETFERLMILGEKFLSPPLTRPALNARNVFLRDPDGRYIMLTSRLR